MAGTVAGGLKAREKNLASDPDYYRKIGAVGGRNGRTGGFYANRELAKVAGAIGGRISRRKKKPAIVTDIVRSDLHETDTDSHTREV